MAKAEELNYVAELFSVLAQAAEEGELELFAEDIMLAAEEAESVERVGRGDGEENDEEDDPRPAPPSLKGPIKGTLHLLDNEKPCKSLTDALRKFCRWAEKRDPDFPQRLLTRTNAVKPPGTHGCKSPRYFKVGRCHVQAYHNYYAWKDLMQLICDEIDLEFGKDIRYETLAR